MSKSKSSLEDSNNDTKKTRKRKIDVSEFMEQQEKKMKTLETTIDGLTKKLTKYDTKHNTKNKTITTMNKDITTIKTTLDDELGYINKKLFQLDKQIINLVDFDDFDESEDLKEDLKKDNNGDYNKGRDFMDLVQDIEDRANKDNDRRGRCRDRDYRPDSMSSLDDSDDELNKTYLQNIKIIEKNMLQKNIQHLDPSTYAKKLYKDKKMKESQRKKELGMIDDYIDLTKNKDSISNLDYFIGLNQKQKLSVIGQLKQIKTQNNDLTPLFFKVINSTLDEYTKNIVLQKIEALASMEIGAGEYHKLNNWIQSLLSIPWNTHSQLPVTYKDPPEKIYQFLKDGKKNMDDVIYGQDNTKNQIIQIISKMISNPEKAGNVFAIYGAPGTGKTTIVKEGMSKALGIPFNFISLGGATDSSYLEGHHYTYEGSTSGKIVDSLKKCGCMNPVFYFDELDKVSNTSKGDEIINMLIHMTDPSQNSLFQDKYFSSIPFDISKAIFVFSFNNIENINKILLDRMELIEVDNFTMKDKHIIVKDYLLPKLFKNYNIPNDKIILPDDIIEYIIDYKGCQSNEKGIRNVIRRFENIVAKLNIMLLTGKNADDIHTSLKNIKSTTFPITIDRQIADDLVSKRVVNRIPPPPAGMYS